MYRVLEEDYNTISSNERELPRQSEIAALRRFFSADEHGNLCFKSYYDEERMILLSLLL